VESRKAVADISAMSSKIVAAMLAAAVALGVAGYLHEAKFISAPPCAVIDGAYTPGRTDNVHPCDPPVPQYRAKATWQDGAAIMLLVAALVIPAFVVIMERYPQFATARLGPNLRAVSVPTPPGGWTPLEPVPVWRQALVFLRRLGRNLMVSLAVVIVVFDVAHRRRGSYGLSPVVVETLMFSGPIMATLIETALPRQTNKPPMVRWGLILGWLSAGLVVGYTVYGFVQLAGDPS